MPEILSINTKASVELIDITARVVDVMARSRIKEGLACVFTPHTTSAIVINENEPNLVSDLVSVFQSLIPWDKSYSHNRIDRNAPAHIIGTLLSPSVTIPVSEGQLSLGTWQSIFFAELDGPRQRRFFVKVVG